MWNDRTGISTTNPTTFEDIWLCWKFQANYMFNNEELHCRLDCIEVIVLCRSIYFSLQYYVSSNCLLQSVSTFHLFRRANKLASCQVKHVRYFDQPPEHQI